MRLFLFSVAILLTMKKKRKIYLCEES